MQPIEAIQATHHLVAQRIGVIGMTQAHVESSATNLQTMRLGSIRAGIRGNRVTFPSQVPTFPKHDRPDLQRRVVQLYFVLGWSVRKIGDRYDLGRVRVQQILHAWKKRAVETGYIQTIPPPEEIALSPEQLPVEIVFSLMQATSLAGVFQNAGHDSNSTNFQDDARPSQRLDASQVSSLLKQLKSGRSVEELAEELGVSASMIQTWRNRQEIRLLRCENTRLKKQISNRDAIEKALMDLITRNDNIPPPPFMPFSRV